MKFNKWTVGLAAVGVVSLASAAHADEQMSQVQTALSQTTLSGYVDTAAQWNPGTDQNSGVRNIPHYAFAKNDGFSLNAVDIALDKPEDSSQWAAGYRVEMMFGPNAVGVPLATTTSSGLGGGSVTTASLATIRQAFIRLHTPVGGNGIDWQVGVFDSPLGYESNSDPLNPNYTRSYGYSIEPTTMTGILGTYKVNDNISFSAGIAQVGGGLGSITPVFYNNNTPVVESQKAYMVAGTLTAPDSMGFLKGATLSAAWIHSSDAKPNGDTGVLGHGTQNNLYVGASIPTPMNQLKLGAAFDYLIQPNFTVNGAGLPINGSGDDDIWVAGIYATYQATDKLSLNVRGEWGFDGSAAIPTAAPIPPLTGGVPTSADTVSLYPGGGPFQEITFTAQYNLWANVMTRAEFRWDHVTHGNWFGASDSSVTETAGGALVPAPYKNDDFMLALNIIYQF